MMFFCRLCASCAEGCFALEEGSNKEMVQKKKKKKMVHMSIKSSVRSI